jgi:hypothetical protein
VQAVLASEGVVRGVVEIGADRREREARARCQRARFEAGRDFLLQHKIYRTGQISLAKGTQANLHERFETDLLLGAHDEYARGVLVDDVRRRALWEKHEVGITSVRRERGMGRTPCVM